MIPKTLLIGIDGVDFSRFQKHFTTPHHWHFHKAYTGGIVGESSHASTYSGPGWASVLTGVWTNKHGVVENNRSLRANPSYPCVLRRLKDYNPKLRVTSTVTWKEIHEFFELQLHDIEHSHVPGNNKAADDEAVYDTVQLIQAGADVNFLHLSDPDNLAHAGVSRSRYDEALEVAFGQIETLRQAVAERESENPGERWLIIVTTDHGRDPKNFRNHGGDSIEEKTVFIATNLPPNAELSDPVLIDGLHELYGCAAHPAIVPTILRHMGALQPADAARLDSIPLIGELGVRKLRVDRKAKALTWHTERTADVSIYKSGRLAEYQRGDAQRWENESLSSAANHFSVVQNGTSASVGFPVYIQCVTEWGPDKLMFFFNNGLYSRFDLSTDRVDTGYPQTVTEQTWPGLAPYRSRMITCFEWNENEIMVFLQGAEYIQFHRSNDTMEGYPKAINDTHLPGLQPYADKIRTAVRGEGDKVYIFLNDNTFLRYDVKAKKLDAGYPATINDYFWPGVAKHADKIVAAVKSNRKNFLYFFLDDMTYLAYDLATQSVNEKFYPAIIPRWWNGLHW